MYLPTQPTDPKHHSCIEQSWGSSEPKFVLKTGHPHYLHCHSDKNSSELEAIRVCAAFNLQLLKKLNTEEAHSLTPVMQHHYFLLTTIPKQWRNNEHWQLISTYEKALGISQGSLPPPPEPPAGPPSAMPLGRKRKEPEDIHKQLLELCMLDAAEKQLIQPTSSTSGEPTPKKRKEVFTLKKPAVKKISGGYLVEERFIGGSRKKKIVEKEGHYYRATHGHSGDPHYIKSFTLDKLQLSRTLIEDCIAQIKNDTTLPKEVKDFLLKKENERLTVIEELIDKKGTSEKNAVENDKSS